MMWEGQYGWEQCVPLHSFGPFIRSHYLFHYVISGRGVLDAHRENGDSRRYELKAGEGFLICSGQINTYYADSEDPWKYVWLEFDGLRVTEYLNSAGLGIRQPIYRPNAAGSGQVRELMLYITDHPEASALHLIRYLCLFLILLQQRQRVSDLRQHAPGPRLRFAVDAVAQRRVKAAQLQQAEGGAALAGPATRETNASRRFCDMCAQAV